MHMNKKVILMILDGWGKSPDPKVSAIDNANTPFIDSLYTTYPNASLRTDGLNVGLPEGQMGNSEVGHMNLGAGRIVYQDLVKVNLAVKNKTLGQEKALIDAFSYAKTNNKNVHFLGLLSDGGVHSHINHLFGLLDAAHDFGLTNVFVHAFTDGRDVDPKSGFGFVTELEEYLEKTTGKLATITGRYYAMDRDKRWERVKLAYDALVNGKGELSTNITKTIQQNYDNDITDEFLKPIIHVDEYRNPVATIKEDDVVIFFNFRTDRGRQLTHALTQEHFHEFNMHKLNLHYVTLTNYEETFKGINVVFSNTGVMEAAIKACEAVDRCVEEVVNTALKNNYTTLLIADHGNCETMINPDGTPNTAHTTNPVPIILIDKDLEHIHDGVLGDLAPTILKLIGIEKPEVMSQNSLI